MRYHITKGRLDTPVEKFLLLSDRSMGEERNSHCYNIRYQIMTVIPITSKPYLAHVRKARFSSNIHPISLPSCVTESHQSHQIVNPYAHLPYPSIHPPTPSLHSTPVQPPSPHQPLSATPPPSPSASHSTLPRSSPSSAPSLPWPCPPRPARSGPGSVR